MVINPPIEEGSIALPETADFRREQKPHNWQFIEAECFV
jgi:hypothetical protein